MATVPQLQGRENYETWYACMKTYLLQHDLWDNITGAEPEVSKPAKQTAYQAPEVPPTTHVEMDRDEKKRNNERLRVEHLTKYTKWHANNCRALQALYNSVPSPWLPDLEVFPTAKTLFEHLDFRFRSELRMQQPSVRYATWTRLRYDGGNLAKFLKRFTVTLRSCERAGLVVPEHIKVHQLLAVLDAALPAYTEARREDISKG
ncbi:uncharacterized protein K452DRAFT_283592 [Aplosporella prunicola CBS 121167]|uniref:DUF4219 domain-containing protein n=1 Tax=Aplosporella prunicola CBS 121167 TaxID=1176127 RepID=A0A6A6BSU2_9PEZI|nr:uncharacterized protein K452DRAFT_283592 [Aplosporella prunicola CBS 121167]KAF2146314.1 hypothetical protein K452DRAFT_283592 [Aplosporella prunicola CBS 121167]